MISKMKEAFDKIRAEEELKARTRAFLAQKTQGYARCSAQPPRHLIAAAACSLFLLAGSYWLYFLPTAEISVDINPSIELGINRFDQVVTVSGYNDGGKELADSLHLKFTSYTEAIHLMLENEKVAALLSSDETLVIAVIGPDGAQCARMLSNIESCTAGQKNTHCYFSHPEQVADAHRVGLSHGKYSAFLELQALDPTVTPEAAQDMTMREIRDAINALLPGSGEEAMPSDSDSHGHHSNGQGYQHRRGWQNSSSSDA